MYYATLSFRTALSSSIFKTYCIIEVVSTQIGIILCPHSHQNGCYVMLRFTFLKALSLLIPLKGPFSCQQVLRLLLEKWQCYCRHCRSRCLLPDWDMTKKFPTFYLKRFWKNLKSNFGKTCLKLIPVKIF